jgi:hypothetical protein
MSVSSWVRFGKEGLLEAAVYSVGLINPALRAANLVRGEALENGLISRIKCPLLTIR